MIPKRLQSGDVSLGDEHVFKRVSFSCLLLIDLRMPPKILHIFYRQVCSSLLKTCLKTQVLSFCWWCRCRDAFEGEVTQFLCNQVVVMVVLVAVVVRKQKRVGFWEYQGKNLFDITSTLVCISNSSGKARVACDRQPNFSRRFHAVERRSNPSCLSPVCLPAAAHSYIPSEASQVFFGVCKRSSFVFL